MQLRISEVARIMRVSEAVVKKWIRIGKLPTRHVQHSTTIEGHDLLEWSILQGLTICPELLNGAALLSSADSLCDALSAGVVIRTSAATLHDDVERLGKELYGDDPAFVAGFVERFNRGNVTGFLSRAATAIPHPRCPVLTRVAAPRLIIWYAHRPLAILAGGVQAIDTLAAVVAGNTKQHVALTVALSNQLADAQFQGLLRQRAPGTDLASYLKGVNQPFAVAGTMSAVDKGTANA
jgi:hypothetical protein